MSGTPGTGVAACGVLRVFAQIVWQPVEHPKMFLFCEHRCERPCVATANQPSTILILSLRLSAVVRRARSFSVRLSVSHLLSTYLGARHPAAASGYVIHSVQPSWYRRWAVCECGAANEETCAYRSHRRRRRRRMCTNSSPKPPTQCRAGAMCVPPTAKPHASSSSSSP